MVVVLTPELKDLADYRVDPRSIEIIGRAAAVSPHGHLGGVHVPVYLLHGAGDTVIPPSETSWLARDVPQACLRSALISAAISHVELGGEPSVQEQFALVHFMYGLLDEMASERMR